MKRNRGRGGGVITWIRRQAVIIPSGLGAKPFQRMVLLYYRMYTHRGTLGNILVFLISVAGIFSSFVRFQFLNIVNTSQMGAAVYTTVWVTVLFSSFTCLLLYLRLLYGCRNIPNLWMYSVKHLRVPGTGLLIALIANGTLGAFAVTMLRNDMLAIAERVEAMEMHILWRTIFAILYYTRIAQRLLECLFMTLVFPVAKLWADTTPIHIRECTVQLLPWRTFHLFQRSLLFMTLIFSRQDYSSSWFHLSWVGVQLYIALCTAWLSLLALYSCTGAGSTRSLVPQRNVSASEEMGSNQVVSGRSLPKVVYTERSPLVVSGPFQRFQAMIHPEREAELTEHQSSVKEEPITQELSLAEKLLYLENEAAEPITTPWPLDPSTKQPLDEEYNRHMVFQEAVEEADIVPSKTHPGRETPEDNSSDSDPRQESDEQPPTPDDNPTDPIQM